MLKDIILPLLAILVSALAVFYTWRGLKIQRDHNKKSLRPIGKFRLGDYESNMFIQIDNHGVGPLILKQIYLNGKVIPTEEGLIHQIPSDRIINVRWKNFSANYPERTIPANGSLDLIWWDREKDFKKTEEEINQVKKELRDIFKNWILKIEYTDIYESEIFEHSLDLTWFGR